jgi:type II secretory pathway component PulF
MGYLQQQEPAELAGQLALLNKIGLPLVHPLPSIQRQESQEKLP